MKSALYAAILILAFPLHAQLKTQTADLRAANTQLPGLPQLPLVSPQPIVRTIVVSLQDRRLALLENGVVSAIYPVAIGRDTTPSPTGAFTIADRVTDPTYYHDGKIIPPGPENPVGDRWMGLSKPGYGIHGTNAPRSIGKAASHGCIRMSRRDLEALFARVRTGDTVLIIGQRDSETAAIFGAPAFGVPAAPAPVLTASTSAVSSSPSTPTTLAAALNAGQ